MAICRLANSYRVAGEIINIAGGYLLSTVLAEWISKMKISSSWIIYLS